jgi:ATP-dependent DNA ligase
MSKIPYMRCSPGAKISNISWPAAIEIKADGMFVNMIKTCAGVSYISRSGITFPMESNEIDDVIMGLSRDAFVLHGELRVHDCVTGRYMPRKRGNGLLNSIAKGNEKNAKKYMHNVRPTVWDMIPYCDFNRGVCDIKYTDRRSLIESLPIDNGLGISPITRSGMKIVHSESEAIEIAQSWIDSGEEGGIIKNLDSIWKNYTSPYWIKLKEEKICELRVVGWIPGKNGTKYEHCIGALICESECGKLKVNVSGLTDLERNMHPDEIFGKIISVRFNAVITSKSKDTASLNLPRVDRGNYGVLEVRYDKDRADTLEYIKSIKNNNGR